MGLTTFALSHVVFAVVHQGRAAVDLQPRHVRRQAAAHLRRRRPGRHRPHDDVRSVPAPAADRPARARAVAGVHRRRRSSSSSSSEVRKAVIHRPLDEASPPDEVGRRQTPTSVPRPDAVADRRAETARSPADVLRLVVAAVALARAPARRGALRQRRSLGFAHDLLRGLDAFSDDFVTASSSPSRVVTHRRSWSPAWSSPSSPAALASPRHGGRWASPPAVVLFVVVERWSTRSGRPRRAVETSPARSRRAASRPARGLAVARGGGRRPLAPGCPRRYRRLGWMLRWRSPGARFVVAPAVGRRRSPPS